MLYKNLLKLNSNIFRHAFLPKYFYFNKHSIVILRKFSTEVETNFEESDSYKYKQNAVYVLRNYVEQNFNFQFPAGDIFNLNFTVESKPESLSLLNEAVKSKCSNITEKALETFKEELPILTLEDILKGIVLFSKTHRDISDADFRDKFALHLDVELLKRNNELSFNNLLEIFYFIRFSFDQHKRVKYFKIYKKLFRKFNNLATREPQEVALLIVALMCFLLSNIIKMETPVKHKMFLYFINNFDKLKLNDLGLIAYGINRYGINLNSKLFDLFVDKLVTNFDDFDLNVRHLLIYVIGKIAPFHLNNSILILQEKMITLIEKFNNDEKVFLPLLLSTGYPLYLNMSLWDAGMKVLKENLKKLQIRHIHDLIKMTVPFNIQDNELLETACDIVKSSDIEKNRKYLLFICQDLVFHNIYPENCIKKLLSDSFFQNNIRKLSIEESHAWWVLYCMTALERPDLGMVLEEDLCRKLFHRFLHTQTNKTYKENVRSKNAKKAIKFLENIYGSDKVSCQFCLPHFDVGVVMRFDENSQALPIPEEYCKQSGTTFKRVPDDKLWLFISFWRNVSSPDLKRNVISKQITELGYVPLCVPNNEFYGARKGGNAEQFLTDLINEKLSLHNTARSEVKEKSLYQKLKMFLFS